MHFLASTMRQFSNQLSITHRRISDIMLTDNANIFNFSLTADASQLNNRSSTQPHAQEISGIPGSLLNPARIRHRSKSHSDEQNIKKVFSILQPLCTQCIIIFYNHYVYSVSIIFCIYEIRVVRLTFF